MLANNLLRKYQAKFETSNVRNGQLGYIYPPTPQLLSIFCQSTHSSVSWTLFPDVWNMQKTTCELGSFPRLSNMVATQFWNEKARDAVRVILVQQKRKPITPLYRKHNYLPSFQLRKPFPPWKPSAASHSTMGQTKTSTKILLRQMPHWGNPAVTSDGRRWCPCCLAYVSSPDLH